MLAAFMRYFKKPPLLGLDVGSDELRLLQLKKRSSGYHLEKMLTQALATSAPSPGKSMDWEMVGTALQELVARAELKGAEVALALPNSVVLKKRLEPLPLLSENELIDELQQRLYEYFPGLSADEIYFDFKTSAVGEERPSLLLVAARKAQLHHPMMAVIQAGLKPVVVDVDLYALARVGAWYFFQSEADHGQAAAIFDVRGSLFSFLAFNAQEIFFNHQGDVEKGSLDALTAPEASLLQSIKNTWQLCQATHPERHIQFLGLSGESAGLDASAVDLQTQLPPQVVVMRPFSKMTYAPSLPVDRVEAQAPRFLLCCGLAMRGRDA